MYIAKTRQRIRVINTSIIASPKLNFKREENNLDLLLDCSINTTSHSFMVLFLKNRIYNQIIDDNLNKEI